MLQAIYWEIKMDIKSTIRYRFGVISDCVIYSLLLCFFILGGTGQSYSKVYANENYKELMVIGYLAWSYAVAAITAISQNVSEELHTGTFYRKLNSRYSLHILLFGRLIAQILIQSIIVIILLIVSAISGQIEFSSKFQVLIPIFISTIGMYGIGIFLAGLALYFKRVGAITYLIQLGLLFVTDTITYSENLTRITKKIPLTICNDIIRRMISSSPCTSEMIELIISAFTCILIGIAFFQIMLYFSSM